ncbi:hypothetical protein [Ferruginivarius sediminum]|uniref:Uncharacterized protein n=1 Tax=Ferruginivarius sediminum TaxID=2661937 RepID=A0A369T8L2_9PROT|nr:hypothetical protein [Ferruginivarius sediminum]RDD61232.1 hypothetical protein DRB17_14195 [Ferruginivarius sediminum]
MHGRKRHKHRKETPGKNSRNGAPEEGRVKPRNPLVPLVRRLGHKRQPDKHAYRRHPKHKKHGLD